MISIFPHNPRRDDCYYFQPGNPHPEWINVGEQVAGELSISVETVRKHVSNALEKTGTKTRAGLVGRAPRR
jgi:hypothetical protein